MDTGGERHREEYDQHRRDRRGPDSRSETYR
jgi:hypothetical protein